MNRFVHFHNALVIGAAASLPSVLAAQTIKPVAPAIAPIKSERIEPGLEKAIHWKWWVLPSDEKAWGLQRPELTPPPAAAATSQNPNETVKPALPADAAPRPSTYEVKKGDALILIAKRFGMTAQQLKTFNGLTTDTIKIGQPLKIPTLEELAAIAPPPPPAPPKPKEPKPARPAAPEAPAEVRVQEDLLLQVFLDREQFSTGPIDGNPGPAFGKAAKRYRDTHADAQDMDAFRQKAQKALGDPYTRYVLKAEDFRFIDQPLGKESPAGKKLPASKGKSPIAEPPPGYEQMAAAPMLAYRTAWEFVAERFHCDEAFLRKLNSRIKGQPGPGAEFQVPNVLPFEVEKALEGSLQPAADPQKVVSAAIVEAAWLEIAVDKNLVALMPLGFARPDLRGRGTWTVLDAIPRPRLATLQEPKDQAKKTAQDPSAEAPTTTDTSVPRAGLASEQYLPPGPNNPVGVVWMNLAKAKSHDPLPYGLHGTSIPSRMKTQEGIGGIRLANWDIVRAVRLLPPGTPLQWK